MLKRRVVLAAATLALVVGVACSSGGKPVAQRAGASASAHVAANGGSAGSEQLSRFGQYVLHVDPKADLTAVSSWLETGIMPANVAFSLDGYSYKAYVQLKPDTTAIREQFEREAKASPFVTSVERCPCQTTQG